MTQDDILSRAEKYSSMIAGWCFNSSGLEKFWREAYEAGQKYEREACIRDCDSVDLVGADECIAAIRARGEK